MIRKVVNGCLATLVLVCLFASLSVSVRAQSLQEPQREHLLNGLHVLLWTRPADPDVLLKLRVHSGAAFDLAGKSGTMGLLGDILFPDPATREYFTDQMQGRLSVVTDYDAITITMQGKASEFERIVEILRNGLVATQLSPEIVKSVRDGRIKILKESSISPSVVADRAIAARFFGDYPYGQPVAGSPESLGRVERPDLMLARERFLNPNNATLAIVGGVQSNRAMRALRQLLGSWRKSEQIVPATFRQPAQPDQRTLIIGAPGDESVEIRMAARGLSRADKDSLAADLLAAIIKERWLALMPELSRGPIFVRHEARLLPGLFVMGATVKPGSASKALLTAKSAIEGLSITPISSAETERAKAGALISVNNLLVSSDGLTEAWLDIDTYKVSAPDNRITSLLRISSPDVQRAASSIFGKGSLASVALGNVEQLRAELEPNMTIEVLGSTDQRSATDAKPPTGNSKKPD